MEDSEVWFPSGCGSKPMGSHLGIGAPPIFVHCDYDLDFDPWPSQAVDSFRPTGLGCGGATQRRHLAAGGPIASRSPTHWF